MMGNCKVRVFVHRGPADMRKSYDTLASLVRHEMNGDITSGDLFLFTGKDRKRCKVLCFDGTGMCIFQKRLSRGHFAYLGSHQPYSLSGGCTSPRPRLRRETQAAG